MDFSKEFAAWIFWAQIFWRWFWELPGNKLAFFDGSAQTTFEADPHFFFQGVGTKKKVWPQDEVSSLGRPLNFTIESVYHADCVRYKVLGCRGRSLLLHCVGRTARLQAADVQHRGLQHWRLMAASWHGVARFYCSVWAAQHVCKLQMCSIEGCSTEGWWQLGRMVRPWGSKWWEVLRQKPLLVSQLLNYLVT